MFIKTIVFLVVSLGSTTYANGKESSCLKVEEQKQLGSILLKLQDAISKDPECLDRWGAGACIMPRDEALKSNLEDRLIECSKE